MKGVRSKNHLQGTRLAANALVNILQNLQVHLMQIVFLKNKKMAFFTSAIDVLQTLVIALGAGLAIWGAVNLLEGYGQDNPASKSQGIKQLMAGGGVATIGVVLVPLLAGLF